MRKSISLFLAVIMAFTVFIILGHTVVNAETTNNIEVENNENTEGEINTENKDQIIEEELKDITGAKVEFEYSNYSYTGKPITPEITVTLEEKVLTNGIDYSIEYSNNIYPGKAEVIITGINNYKGSVGATFEIAKVLNFKVTSIGSNSIKVSWSSQKSVKGYKIYSYSSAKKAWSLRETIKAPAKSCTIDKLGSGYNYMLKIESYVGLHNSSSSEYLYVSTKPARVVLSSFTTTPKLTATVKWGKKKSTGYQVLVSRYSDFDNAKKYTIKSSDTLSKKFTSLKNGKYYYVKVRAYKTYKGKTSYGIYSKPKRVKATNSGWLTSDGKKYYYKNGKPLTGQQTISGNQYYFSKSAKGKLMGATYEMWNNIKDKKSNTNYLIAVSRKLNRTCVYYKKDGIWTLKYYWKCTTGEIGVWTPRGSFLVPKTKTNLKSFGDSTYVVWYATRFKNACYFHSILYKPGSKTKVVDGRLGQNLSHGCIRLKLENAKWIYDNIKPGTRVVVY